MLKRDIFIQVKGLVQEQQLEREVERVRRMEKEREAVERELKEKETQLESSAHSLQAKEHHFRLAEEQVHKTLYKAKQTFFMREELVTNKDFEEKMCHIVRRWLLLAKFLTNENLK